MAELLGCLLEGEPDKIAAKAWEGVTMCYPAIGFVVDDMPDIISMVEGVSAVVVKKHAKMALDANKGLAMQWNISPDDALALPNFKLVDARDVEAYAAGTRRPVGWI